MEAVLKDHQDHPERRLEVAAGKKGHITDPLHYLRVVVKNKKSLNESSITAAAASATKRVATQEIRRRRIECGGENVKRKETLPYKE